MRSRILRDIKARQSLADNELTRQAYRYVTRNETLPARVRHQAQLALNALPKQSSPAFIANRCVATGHGSGILREFKLCRFQFRLKALNGELPGVKKFLGRLYTHIHFDIIPDLHLYPFFLITPCVSHPHIINFSSPSPFPHICHS
ncbi:unnamed protein product [Absidia cylindrospora]